MYSRLLSTISLYFGANFLSKGINFLFFIWLSRNITIEEMGAFSLLSMVITIISLIMILELPSGFNRYYMEQQEADRDEFEYSIISFLLLINIVFAILCVVFYIFIPELVEFLPQDNLALLLVLFVPFGNAVINIYQTKMRLTQRRKSVALVLLCQSIGYVAFFAVLLNLGLSKLSSLMGAFIGQNIVPFFLYFKALPKWRFYINWNKIKECFRFSIWLIPSSIGAYFSLLSGKYFLGSLGMLKELGIYEGNYKVSNTFQLLMEPVYMAVAPIYFTKYKEKDYVCFYFQILRYMILFLAILVVLLEVFAHEVVAIILGSQYVEFSLYLYFFILLSIFQFFSNVFAINIHLAKKSYYDTVIEFVSGVVNCFLCYWVLVVYHGALLELIIVVCMCYLLRLFLYVWIANKSFPKTAFSIKYFWGIIFCVFFVSFFNFVFYSELLLIRLVIGCIEILIIFAVGNYVFDATMSIKGFVKYIR